jgi:hypothetical protein
MTTFSRPWMREYARRQRRAFKWGKHIHKLVCAPAVDLFGVTREFKRKFRYARRQQNKALRAQLKAFARRFDA